MIPASFEYRSPETRDELFDLLVRHGDGASLLAGGQSLVLALRCRRVRPSVVIDLRRMPDLSVIEPTSEGLRLGALVPLSVIASSSLVWSRCPLLAIAAGSVGDARVRNLATLGGCLAAAEPGSDPPAALIALGARVSLASRTGVKLARVEDFIQGPGETALGEAEFVDAVLVPTSSGARCAYLKEARGPVGYALTGVAVELLGSEGGIEAVRLGVTGAASRPFRAHAIEALLLGVSAAPELPTDPVAWGAPGGCFLHDEHASAEYRAHILACVARRAVNEALRKR